MYIYINIYIYTVYYVYIFIYIYTVYYVYIFIYILYIMYVCIQRHMFLMQERRCSLTRSASRKDPHQGKCVYVRLAAGGTGLPPLITLSRRGFKVKAIR